ncbi:MAG TPA: hypothetical protein VFA56_09780 [Gaiellaceae bacterium]|nr:hypothetical protein [Gaiellaceae bacterium]
MITFFTIPKPFDGHIGIIQRNALRSWLRVAPDAQVIAIGERAAEPGIEDLAEVARNDHGTPLLDDAFRLAHERARHDVLCFCNTDILLPVTLAAAVRTIRTRAPFLVVGECRDVRVDTELGDGHWPSGGRRRGADALDYFVFSRGLYDDVPPFAAGRPAFDNWLVWRARSEGATVVDATWAIAALHQAHSYAHVGSLRERSSSVEAEENRRLVGGGRERLYSRFDATHRLVGGMLVSNPLAAGHSGETIRRAWAKVAYATGLRTR